MGCFDIFCFICGNNCNNLIQRDANSEYNKIFKKLNWKINCTVLLPNNDVVHNCTETACSIDFTNYLTKKNYSANLWLNDLNYFDNYISNRGIFLHTDCWKYIKNAYGIELKYKDIPVFYTKNYAPLKIKYGDITKYWDQDLDYEKMFFDKNIYMAFSPLESDNIKNITRIKKIVSQIKLKKEKRIGPSVSATFYPNKTIKLGNNNLFWEKKNNKWVELKEEIKIKLYEFINIPKNIKKINDIPQIGEFNKIPLFVNDFYIKNKKYYIKFIGTDKTINDLDKYLSKQI